MVKAVTGYGWAKVPGETYTAAFELPVLVGHQDGITNVQVFVTDGTTENTITVTDRSYTQVATDYDNHAVYASVYVADITAGLLSSLNDGVVWCWGKVTYSGGEQRFRDPWFFYNNTGTPGYSEPCTDQVAGGILYVKPSTGSDSNSGTSSGSSLKTLERAIEYMTGGNTSPLGVNQGDAGGGIIEIAEAGNIQYPQRVPTGLYGKNTKWLTIRSGEGLAFDDVKINRVQGRGPSQLQYVKFQQVHVDDTTLDHPSSDGVIQWLDQCKVTSADINAPTSGFSANEKMRTFATGTRWDTMVHGPGMPDLSIGVDIRNMLTDAYIPWNNPNKTCIGLDVQDVVQVAPHHADIFQWLKPGGNTMMQGIRCTGSLAAFLFNSGEYIPDVWLENALMYSIGGQPPTQLEDLHNWTIRHLTILGQSMIFDANKPLTSFEISNSIIGKLAAFPGSNSVLASKLTLSNNIYSPDSFVTSGGVVATPYFPNLTGSPLNYDMRLGPTSPGFGAGKTYDYTMPAGEIGNLGSPYNVNCGAWLGTAVGDRRDHTTYGLGSP